MEETIVAIASAPGGAARGILRISGPGALAQAQKLFEPEEPLDWDSLRAPTAIRGHARVDAHQKLPGQMLLWPTTKSYTREPLVEIHTISSPPLLEKILREACSAGARLARPGEFTLRAFLAGRIDLVQAEAVLGVIDARGEAELQRALTQMAGGIFQPLHDLREKLLDDLAHLEAGLDFVEEDIEFISRDELGTLLREGCEAVEAIEQRMASRAEVHRSAQIVLYGWPNAGKSSLFNALVGESTAIVADLPGTTRDYLTARIELEGVSCTLIDTAGKEAPPEDDELAQFAQSATARQQQAADLRVLCLDASRPLNAWEEEQLRTNSDVRRMIVATKIDLASKTNLPSAVTVATSSQTGEGIEPLRREIGRWAMDLIDQESGVVASTAARCRRSLRGAGQSLLQSLSLLEKEAGEELIAEEMRTALADLSEVLGAVYTDDILDRIFSRFCIGK